MTWGIKYLPEAIEDLKSLDGSQRTVVMKAIKKVSQNPLPADEGGYGKPLGKRNQTNLSGCMKVKLKSLGIRIVYRIERTDKNMNVIVIGARADDEVYKIAQKRLNNLKK